MKNDTKEMMSYIIVGGLTTLVNYLAYYILLAVHCHWIIANSVSWFVAVIFAFYTNKKYVFKSTKSVKDEIVSFFIMRFATLIIENISLFLFIELLGYQQMLSKILVSVVTVVLNYILCKFKIFKKEGAYCG